MPGAKDRYWCEDCRTVCYASGKCLDCGGSNVRRLTRRYVSLRLLQLELDAESRRQDARFQERLRLGPVGLCKTCGGRPKHKQKYLRTAGAGPDKNRRMAGTVLSTRVSGQTVEVRVCECHT